MTGQLEAKRRAAAINVLQPLNRFHKTRQKHSLLHLSWDMYYWQAKNAAKQNVLRRLCFQAARDSHRHHLACEIQKTKAAAEDRTPVTGPVYEEQKYNFTDYDLRCLFTDFTFHRL